MYTFDSGSAAVQQGVMSAQKKEPKPLKSARVHPEMTAGLAKLAKRVNETSTGRVTLGAIWGAAIAALLDLPEKRQEELIFAVSKLGDESLSDDPRLKRLRTILQKDPQRP